MVAVRECLPGEFLCNRLVNKKRKRLKISENLESTRLSGNNVSTREYLLKQRSDMHLRKIYFLFFPGY